MSETARTSRTVPIAALVMVLCGAEVAVVGSDMGDAARYGLGAVVLAALLAAVFQLGRTLRSFR
ncbi:hypothetical protein [Streptomyces sp. SID5910]|uniref:hypothetical protein n=1 Tax=Streptomyces sp. SID5910 TaxID=2690312 RepID=UPI00137008AB|nr:hypothetical protein [Streptomyces sp. SID5910]MYR44894.1 hypothetical protein [Streptomyces sp. SID5910]